MNDNKTDKLDYNNIKNFHSSKDTFMSEKGNHRVKKCAMHTKNSYKIKRKASKQEEKWAKT